MKIIQDFIDLDFCHKLECDIKYVSHSACRSLVTPLHITLDNIINELAEEIENKLKK